MTPEQIAEALKERFGDRITACVFETAHPHVFVAAEAWPEIAVFLRDDTRLRLNFLRCISAVDMLEDDELVAVYDLYSARSPSSGGATWTMGPACCVKIKVPRDNPRIPSVADVWRAADWHEREAYDLMGIIFDGHPDSVTDAAGLHPRRILCPDDWEGHPLRKDYRFPMEYNGIPAVTEFDQTRPVH